MRSDKSQVFGSNLGRILIQTAKLV